MGYGPECARKVSSAHVNADARLAALLGAAFDYGDARGGHRVQGVLAGSPRPKARADDELIARFALVAVVARLDSRRRSAR